MDIHELLMEAVKQKASDLHLNAGSHPVLRVNGELISQSNYPILTEEDTERLLTAITSDEQRKKFENDLELDFAYSIQAAGRFRANACLQRGSTGLCFRLLQVIIPDVDELGLPEICKDLALRERGMIIVSGPTGSGKSTTLASMIKYLNSLRSRRIITIEDPIEFLYENDRSFITQRELGTDTSAFATALKHALRQDPDVILVGEIRDLDTISTALTAAETGHLILTTLHTPSAPQAIDRMIDVFPPYQQQQVRTQLSTVLEAVMYQTLLPKADGTGRTVAVEIMLANDAIRNLIREAKTSHMWNVMQTGGASGMQTIDQSLLHLYTRRIVNLDEALLRCRDPETAKKSLARA